jgi:Golgi apyrase
MRYELWHNMIVIETLWRIKYHIKRYRLFQCLNISRKLLLIVVIALILGTWLTFELLTVPPEEYMNYGVIIDAGSSGSRLYIYSYQYLNGTHRLPYVSLAEDTVITNHTFSALSSDHHHRVRPKTWQHRIEPGMSSFINQLDYLGVKHLKPLLDFADEKLPKHKRHKVSLYILATAGMRMVGLKAQKKIIYETCRYIKSYYLYHFECDHFMIISGEMEGVYGWLSVNYLLHRFPTQISLMEGTNRTDNNETYGFVDLGGGSTQIAFEIDNKDKQYIPKELIQEVVLRDGRHRIISSYNLYVSTYLGYGSNVVRYRHIDRMKDLAAAHLVDQPESTAALIIKDPCAPRHYEYQPHILGTGNLTECINELKTYLNKTLSCKAPLCSFNGVYQPQIDFRRRQFIGVSDLWYIANDIYRLGGIYDHANFRRTTEHFCSTPWSTIKDIFLSNATETTTKEKLVTNELRLEAQCFKAAWMITLLHEGYGFPMNNASSELVSNEFFLLRTANDIYIRCFGTIVHDHHQMGRDWINNIHSHGDSIGSEIHPVKTSSCDTNMRPPHTL